MEFLNDKFDFKKTFYIPEIPVDRIRSKKTRKLK